MIGNIDSIQKEWELSARLWPKLSVYIKTIQTLLYNGWGFGAELYPNEWKSMLESYTTWDPDRRLSHEEARIIHSFESKTYCDKDGWVITKWAKGFEHLNKWWPKPKPPKIIFQPDAKWFKSNNFTNQSNNGVSFKGDRWLIGDVQFYPEYSKQVLDLISELLTP